MSNQIKPGGPAFISVPDEYVCAPYVNGLVVTTVRLIEAGLWEVAPKIEFEHKGVHVLLEGCEAKYLRPIGGQHVDKTVTNEVTA